MVGKPKRHPRNVSDALDKKLRDYSKDCSLKKETNLMVRTNTDCNYSPCQKKETKAGLSANVKIVGG